MLTSILLVLVLTPSLPEQQRFTSLREFLDRRFDLATEDWTVIQSGEPVVKLRPGRSKSETRLLGVVKIRGSPEVFVERYRDIVTFEKGAGVLEIGRFGEPPKVDDLKSLTLEPEDLEGVKKCRPGDCDVKLTAGAIEAFRELDWEAKDAAGEAHMLARRMIVDLLEAYRKGGNEALGELHDKKKPLLVGQQFEEMLHDPDLPVNLPELYSFLSEYPAASIPGAEDLFYWSKVDFGLKPLIRLNHVVIYEPEEPAIVKHVVASKMLYTTHYFDTGLEMKFVVVEPDAPGAYYVVAANRSRSDGFTGFTGWLIRGKIRGKARDGLESYLRSVRKELEEAR